MRKDDEHDKTPLVRIPPILLLEEEEDKSVVFVGVVPVDAVVAVARWVTPRIVISSLLPTIIRFSQVKIKVVVWPFFFLKNPFF